MATKVCVTIDSKYHRYQFDDWLAGGRVEFGGKIYYWSAQNSGYGFGWEIDPVTEEDWTGLSEAEYEQIINLVAECLVRHRTEYIGQMRAGGISS